MKLTLADIFKFAIPIPSIIDSVVLECVDMFCKVSFTSKNANVTGSISFPKVIDIDIVGKIGITSPVEFVRTLKNIGNRIKLNPGSDSTICLKNLDNGMTINYPISPYNDLPKISVPKSSILDGNSYGRSFTKTEIQSIINMLSAVSDCKYVTIETNTNGSWLFSSTQSNRVSTGGNLIINTELALFPVDPAAEYSVSLDIKLLAAIFGFYKKFDSIELRIYNGILFGVKYATVDNVKIEYYLPVNN